MRAVRSIEKTTPWLSWSDISHAEKILGHVPDGSKGSMYTVSAQLKNRVREGKVIKRTEGRRAWYKLVKF